MPLPQTTGLAPAVFLDRDGTLIEDNGSLRSPTQVVFYAATAPALRQLQEHFRLFVVTNQSGVAKGELTLDEARQVNAHVVERLREHGVQIGAVYCCPHQRADDCACIKPKPFFLEQAAREHGLDLRRSFVIGDHPHDVELACNAGATGVYVLTGHGLKHRGELRGDEIVTGNIAEAADWILNTVAGTVPQRARRAPSGDGKEAV
jgi:histidinol-phosphate phosphatase family protein